MLSSCSALRQLLDVLISVLLDTFSCILKFISDFTTATKQDTVPHSHTEFSPRILITPIAMTMYVKYGYELDDAKAAQYMCSTAILAL